MSPFLVLKPGEPKPEVGPATGRADLVREWQALWAMTPLAIVISALRASPPRSSSAPADDL